MIAPVFPPPPRTAVQPLEPDASSGPRSTGFGVADFGATGFGNTGFGNTGFGTTGFDGSILGPATKAPTASVFDVCHVGVVLRALLFVHGALAIGLLFGAATWQGWLLLFATGAGTALPGVLLWLLAACALKRPLGALRLGWQRVAVIGLGAASGGAAAAFTLLLGNDLPAQPALIAPAVAGAAVAALAFQWLQLRALALQPADATARLAELQSRIRPHFLFNTLNSALTLVRLDPLRAETVLEDLAELFRVAITAGAEAVTLADEIELARRYLAIEQVRFGERLRVSWDLDAAAGAARVPPLLLQPLVENAVRHGVEPADAGGTVRIRTRVKLGRVLISIVNSVPDEPSVPGSGIALRNVRERLRLMHDVAAEFDTQLKADGFRVKIVVPL